MSVLSVLEGHAKNLEIRIRNSQISMDENVRNFLNHHMLQVLDKTELREISLQITKMEEDS